MSITIDDIPTAEQSLKERDERNKEYSHQKQMKDIIMQKRRSAYLQQSNELCDKYKEYMLTCIKESIENWKTSKCVIVNATLEAILEVGSRKCKAHFVHYGNYSCTSGQGHWRDRVPFVEGRNPFQELQRELYQKKGWILLDESNPERSFNIVIRLYYEIPAHYEKAPIIWHGLNKLPTMD